MTENEVVDQVKAWLETRGFTIQSYCKDRQKGDDIAATSKAGKRLFVECKGSHSQAGNRLSDWDSAAMAVFGAVVEKYSKRPDDEHAIAVPDDPQYHKTLDPLRTFFERNGIILVWVQAGGEVHVIGAPINLFRDH